MASASAASRSPLVTGYPQCRNRGAFICHHDGIVAYRRHFAAEEPSPERCEASRVLTIEADHSQASQCHTGMLAPTPQRQPILRLGDHALFPGSQPGGYGGPRLSQHLGLEQVAV